MTSKELKTCKKAIEQATTKHEVRLAVDLLDDLWNAENQSEEIMRDDDWPILVECIHQASMRIEEKEKQIKKEKDMKDQLQQYTQDAIRTESQIDKVQLNPVFFLSVLDIAVQAGNMLDQMKKHAFYGKPYNEDAIKEGFATIISSLDGIKHSLPEIDTNETSFEIDPRVFHAILGIATESTELLEALDINGKGMDTVNILEESFDVDWYQFILMDALGGDLQNVWDTGIAKLRARYPDKFTNEDAINRDLDTEREILDQLNKSLDD